MVLDWLFAVVVLVMKHLTDTNHHQCNMFKEYREFYRIRRQGMFARGRSIPTRYRCNSVFTVNRTDRKLSAASSGNSILEQVQNPKDADVKPALCYIVYGVAVYYLFVVPVGLTVFVALYRMIHVSGV